MISGIGVRVLCYTSGMVLEKKGNFSLCFLFAKLGMWGVSCFSCIVFLLGKGSRSSPPHPPGNEEESGLWSEEQMLAIALTLFFSPT